MVYAYAAIQHLGYDRSTVDLAEELGVSRFMVGRMIKRARDDGLIEITPRLPDPIDPQLSQALAAAYGLNVAIVVVSPTQDDVHVRTIISTAAAHLLADLIDEDDIVGLGPGRTILQSCERLESTAHCDVVQLTGGAAAEPEEHLSAIMRLSSVAKGRMFALHAPFLATNERSWTAITGEPDVRKALSRMDRVDKAVLTVGGWPDSSLLASQLEELGEIDTLQAQGVVAEFGTTLLDADGQEVRSLDRRLIGISSEQLRRVPLKIALGGGEGKTRAVIAALRSGLVDIMVTDEATARAAIDAR
ncbi:sugar-binding transcriptional regulator [Microbacterium sp. SA39]|uniref:sugar-binding transcriptional regulator n=1 Tax=Microbacterium sp. SA39 TaxID=1263625 RepID=UPI001364DA4D|nr:sugar-binding domain-containing protein [Microbacterium sp. SA39]